MKQSCFVLGLVALISSARFADLAPCSLPNGGIVVLSAACEIPSGTYNLASLLITNSATITVQADTTTGASVLINAAAFQIDAGATLSGTGQGFLCSSGPSGGARGARGGGGGGHGGQGGSGSDGVSGAACGHTLRPVVLGGGGGGVQGTACGNYSQCPGGRGGSSIRIFVPAGTVNVSGSILMDGATGGTYAPGCGLTLYGGSGAGGSVWIAAASFVGTGLVRVNGGPGVGSAGSGSGGRIAVYSASSAFSGSLIARGGVGGNENGGHGTIYLENTSTSTTTLVVDNRGAASMRPAWLMSDPDTGVFPVVFSFSQVNLIGTGAIHLPHPAWSLTVANLLGDFSGTLSTAGAADISACTPNLPASLDIKFGGFLTTPSSVVLRAVALSVSGTLIGAQNITLELAGQLNLFGSGATSGTAPGRYVFSGDLTASHTSTVTIDPRDTTGGMNITFGGPVLLQNTAAMQVYAAQTGGTWLAASSFTMLHTSNMNVYGHLTTGTAVTLVTPSEFNTAMGSRINGDGLGFPSRTGPGAGLTFYGGTGAGHGGQGGVGTDGTATGAAYGNLFTPASLGSGGGGGAYTNGYCGNHTYQNLGGSGGAAVRILVGTVFTHNGTISMAGAIGTTASPGCSVTVVGGGGSGGSIWIDTALFAGTGTLTAPGGQGRGSSSASGGGSGGRIAVWYNETTFSGTMLAIGGAGSAAEFGGRGTVYLFDKSTGFSHLIINGGGVQTSSVWLDAAGLSLSRPAFLMNDPVNGVTTVQSYTFSRITLLNYGDFLLPFPLWGMTVLSLAGDRTGVLYTVGTTDLTACAPLLPVGLYVYPAGTLRLPPSVDVSGVMVAVHGTLSGAQQNLTVSQTTGNLRLYGDGNTLGSPDSQYDFAGTLLVNQGLVLIDPRSAAATAAGTIVNFGGSVTVQTSGQLQVYASQLDGTLVSCGSFSLSSGSSVTVGGNTNSGKTVTLVVSGAMSTSSGTSINGDGLGFPSRTGPGAGLTFYGGTGAGHGGQGGAGSLATSSGAAYGNLFTPASLGSGGGGSSYTNCGTYNFQNLGGSGGAAIRIVVGTVFTHNGTISMAGAIGTTAGPGCSVTVVGGGGSGGSIWIDTALFAGTGTLTAPGGQGQSATSRGGGGSGGRIGVWYNETRFNGTILAVGGGGAAHENGGRGTVYLYDKSTAFRHLVVNGGGLQTSSVWLDAAGLSLSRPAWLMNDPVNGVTTVQAFTFSRVTLLNYGDFLLPYPLWTMTALSLAGDRTGVLYTNGTTDLTACETVLPLGLYVYPAGTLNLGPSVDVSGVMLAVHGTLSGAQQNLTVRQTTGNLRLYGDGKTDGSPASKYVFAGTLLVNQAMLLADPRTATAAPAGLILAFGGGVTVRLSAQVTLYASQLNGTHLFADSLLLDSGSTLTVPAHTTSGRTVTLWVTNDMTTATGTVIFGDGLGFPSRTGTGAGANGYCGGGAGHGGPGGRSSDNAANAPAYGNLFQPIAVGSGGGGVAFTNCGIWSNPTTGGRGGSTIRISVGGRFTHNGSITMNGVQGSSYGPGCGLTAWGGGGSGGSIWIDAGIWTGTGSLSVVGGIGRAGSCTSGGASAGRIAVHYGATTVTDAMMVSMCRPVYTAAVNFNVYSGTGFEAGGRGTVYLLNRGNGYSRLIVDGANVASGTGQPAWLLADPLVSGIVGDFAFTDVHLRGGGTTILPYTPWTMYINGNTSGDSTQTLQVNGPLVVRAPLLMGFSIIVPSTGTLTFADYQEIRASTVTVAGVLAGASMLLSLTQSATLTLQSGSRSSGRAVGTYAFCGLTVGNYSTVNLWSNTASNSGVTFIANQVTVQRNGLINSAGTGFAAQTGSGAGGAASPDGNGAGHAGLGGAGSSGTRGPTYGSAALPLTIGSGGGNANGGAGGGAVRVSATSSVTVDGTISVNGNNGASANPSGGGGSGGSILIETPAVIGVGLLSAAGGAGGVNGANRGGGGSGGYVTIITQSAVPDSVAVSLLGGTGSRTPAASNGTYTVSALAAPPTSVCFASPSVSTGTTGTSGNLAQLLPDCSTTAATTAARTSSVDTTAVLGYTTSPFAGTTGPGTTSTGTSSSGTTSSGTTSTGTTSTGSTGTTSTGTSNTGTTVTSSASIGMTSAGTTSTGAQSNEEMPAPLTCSPDTFAINHMNATVFTASTDGVCACRTWVATTDVRVNNTSLLARIQELEERSRTGAARMAYLESMLEHLLNASNHPAGRTT